MKRALIDHRPDGSGRILFRLPAPLVALAIFALSSQPSVPLPKGVFGVDKIAHFIAYGVLAAAIAFWPSRGSWRARPVITACIVFALAALYGASDEFHQSFVPGRDMSAWDWLADAIGAALGAASGAGIVIHEKNARLMRGE